MIHIQAGYINIIFFCENVILIIIKIFSHFTYESFKIHVHLQSKKEFNIREINEFQIFFMDFSIHNKLHTRTIIQI